MVSFWWVLAAFIGGGCAGVLVMALMCFAGGLPEETDVRGTADRLKDIFGFEPPRDSSSHPPQ
jgi:hypothetical protein